MALSQQQHADAFQQGQNFIQVVGVGGGGNIPRSRLADEAVRLDQVSNAAASYLSRLEALCDAIDGSGSAKEDPSLNKAASSGHINRVARSIDELEATVKGIGAQIDRLRGLVG